MKVSVVRTGSRFALNLPHASYNRGETHKILWNTANTNQAPVNCDAVDISLSVNGGYEYNQKLATNIPNTGSAWITIPTDTYLSQAARFKVKCSNNVFFAISSRDFTIAKKGTKNSPDLADADQPESQLLDREEGGDDTPVSNNSSVVSGGGGFDGILLMLGLLALIRRRNVLLLMK